MLSKMCTLLAALRGVIAHSRTMLPLIAIGAVLLGLGTYGAWRVHRLHQRSTDILSENVTSIRSAEEFGTIMREVRLRIKRYLETHDAQQLARIDHLLAAGQEKLRDSLELSSSQQEKQLMRNAEDRYHYLQRQYQLASEEQRPERDVILSELADVVIVDQLLRYADSYVELNEEQLQHSQQRNQANADRLVLGLLVLGTCGGVAGLLAGYGIARLVNRTIVQLAVPLRTTAGKLSQVAGPVNVSAKPGFDDIELVLQNVSGHVTDVVTRLQESERDRLRAEQLAVLGQVAAGLAHELRNPLTSMKAILQLAERPEDLSARELDILKEESERLQKSIQALLDYARPPGPRKSPTQLTEILEQTVSLVQRQAQQKGAVLRYIPPDEDVCLLADAAQIRQVLLNLMLNAIEFSPAEGVIRLECLIDEAPENGGGSGLRKRTRLSRKRTVVIRVADNGVGLPAELGHRIFQPFVTTKETGTGLGLSICQQIVNAHEGKITCRNRPTGGAVFEVRLPLYTTSMKVSPSADAALARHGTGFESFA